MRSIVVEVLSQVHESEHENDQVDRENDLRLVKDVVVKYKDQGQGEKHEELCVKQSEDEEVGAKGGLLAVRCLAYGAGAWHASLILSSECIEHVMHLLVKHVVVRPFLAHKLRNLLQTIDIIVLIFCQVILIS